MPLSRDPRKRERQLANLDRHPPAPPPGNTRAVSHGGYARIAHERLDAKEREVFEALADDVPLRNEDGSLAPAYAAQLRLLADVMCRLDSIVSYLRDYGLVDPKTKQPRESLLALESRLRNEARDHLNDLAMNVASQFRVGVDYARGTSLIEKMAEARSEIDAEEVVDE